MVLPLNKMNVKYPPSKFSLEVTHVLIFHGFFIANEKDRFYDTSLLT